MGQVREIADVTRIGMQSIVRKNGSKKLSFDLISKVSGVSTSMVAKFFYGDRDNPTLEVLDAMAAAVRYLDR